MSKLKALNVDDYVPESATDLPPDEPQATLYLRCPLSVAQRMRTMAFERSRGRMKRTTQNDLLMEAVKRYLEAEGF